METTGSSRDADARSGPVEWAIACCIVLFLLSSFYARSAFQQYADSATFYYEALILAKGGLPFVDFIDNKNPGIYYLLYPAALISGWSMGAAVVLFRVLDAAIIALIFLLVRAMAISRMSSLTITFLAALFYAGCFPNPRETFYTEIPETLISSLIYLLLLRNSTRYFFLGILAGLNVLFRQTALIDLVFLCVCAATFNPGDDGNRASGIMRRLFRLVGGFLTPLLLVTTFAYTQGWLDDWIRNAYVWNADYARAYPPFYWRTPGVIRELLFHPQFMPLAFAGLAGCLSLCGSSPSRSRNDWRTPVFIILNLALHLVETSSSGIRYSHHFITMIPPLAIAAAFAMKSFEQSPREGTHLENILLYGAFLVALVVAPLQMFVHFREDAGNVGEIEEISKWLNANTAPEDKVLSWGLKSELYIFSQRHSPTAFHHNLSLTNQSRTFLPIDEDFLAKFRQEMRSDLPKFIFLFASRGAYEDFLFYFPFAAQGYELKTLATDHGSIQYLERKA